MVWSGPLQILTVLALLARVIGAAPAAVALAATVALVPASALVARALGRVRRRLVKLTDARVKLCAEVVTGVRAIKLYAWEEAYAERIAALRGEELAAIRAQALIGTWCAERNLGSDSCLVGFQASAFEFQPPATTAPLAPNRNNVLWLGGPTLISMAAFAAHAALGRPLTPAVAFPALALFNLLRFPVMMFPQQLLNLVNARVALSRLQAFVEAGEAAAPPRRPPGDPAVEVRAGAFAWAPTGPPVLEGVELAVPRGALVMVVGAVGAGKTTLLEALLGEAPARSGSTVTVRGTVAYCAQSPWIQNASLRENVLLGMPLDAGRYAAALEAAALGPDVAALPAGDATEIGEKVRCCCGGGWAAVGYLRSLPPYLIAVRPSAPAADPSPTQPTSRPTHTAQGVNLSGGQRARVALARAAYAAADVYLLDDPLSAVDAHVGAHLMARCVRGLLASSTRVLVTHQLQHLPLADEVLVLRGGRVAARGPYAALRAAGVDFGEIARAAEGGEGGGEKEGGGGGGGCAENGAAEEAAAPDTAAPLLEPLPDDAPALAGAALGLLADALPAEGPASDAGSEPASDEDVSPSAAALKPPPAAQRAQHPQHAQLTRAEGRAEGRVDRGVYTRYFRAYGPGLWVPLIVLVLAAVERGLQAGQSWWLAVWSEAGTGGAGGAPGGHFLAVYFALGLVSLALQVIKAVVLVIGALAAARALHAGLLATVLRLPMAFFDAQPSGRLLNRFAKDTEAVDVSLASSVSSFLNCAVSVVWSLAVVVAVSPGVALAVVPLAWAYARVQVGGCVGWVVVGVLLVCLELRVDSIRRGLLLPCTFAPVPLQPPFNHHLPTPRSPPPPFSLPPTTQNLYVATSRELKRLDSLALSPIFGHFSATLAGLATLRAARAEGRFAAANADLLDASNRALWPAQVANRWLSVRLELLGTGVVFGAAAAVAAVQPTSPGLAGLALTSALNLTGLMNWMVRQTTELEVNMNSVERLVEYDGQVRPCVWLWISMSSRCVFIHWTSFNYFFDLFLQLY
jgi:ATP-binding cassette subfamily C (CFTR/MRP) protein 1